MHDVRPRNASEKHRSKRDSACQPELVVGVGPREKGILCMAIRLSGSLPDSLFVPSCALVQGLIARLAPWKGSLQPALCEGAGGENEVAGERR